MFNPFVEHENVKSSTVLLSNSGVLEKKLSYPYTGAPSVLVILVPLMPQACNLEGLLGVLSMEDPLCVQMPQERRKRKQFKILQSQRERHFSQIWLRVDLTVQSTRHTCVLIGPLISSENTLQVIFSDSAHLQ